MRDVLNRLPANKDKKDAKNEFNGSLECYVEH